MIPQLLHDLTAGMDGETARLQHVLEDLAHLHDQVLGGLEMKRERISLSEWLHADAGALAGSRPGKAPALVGKICRRICPCPGRPGALCRR